MRVYVETNFLLEVAFDQEQASACEQLLLLAERGALTLAVPAFSLVEAAAARALRVNAVLEFSRQTQVPEVLNRLPWLDRAVVDFRARIVSEIAATGERLKAVTKRLQDASEVLPLDGEVLSECAALADCGLKPPDLTVLASVVANARTVKAHDHSLFLNRNSKDFQKEAVKRFLAEQQCELLPSFAGGLDYVRARLPK